MTDPKKTSLSSLYEQRKSKHTLSKAQHAELHRALRKPKRRNWTVAVPTLAASMMVVVLLWPTLQTTIREDNFEASAVAIEQLDTLELEPSLEIDSVAADDYLAEEAPVAASKMAAPATLPMESKEQRSELADAYADSDEADELMTLEILMEETAFVEWTAESPSLLFVTDSEARLARDCDGNVYALPDDVELNSDQWIELTITDENQTLVTVVTDAECD